MTRSDNISPTAIAVYIFGTCIAPGEYSLPSLAQVLCYFLTALEAILSWISRGNEVSKKRMHALHSGREIKITQFVLVSNLKTKILSPTLSLVLSN